MGGDDHRELGLIALEVRASEQRPEYRHVTDPRQLTDVTGVVILKQTGDREALAVLQFDRRLDAVGLETRNVEIRDAHRRRRVVDRTHLRFDDEVDALLVEHGRRESERDAKLLELDGDYRPAGAGLRHRNRKLTAGEEA